MSEMSLGLSSAALTPAKPEAKRYFFDVSVVKLIVMSIVTLNLYQVYWFYRNWRLAKERGEDLMPLARAIFAVLFAYPLFKEVRQTGRGTGVNAAANAGALAFLFFALQLTWRLPDPLWLLGFTTVLPLAMIQADVARIHASLGLDPRVNHRFSWKNIIGLIVGGFWILLMLIGLFLPQTAA